jgi:predicted RNA-binding Zn ribbon-like protein
MKDEFLKRMLTEAIAHMREALAAHVRGAYKADVLTEERLEELERDIRAAIAMREREKSTG